MALAEIPTRTDGVPHYTQRTKLDGTDYEFTFRFGERRGAWVFDLYTLDGVEIVSGQLLTLGRDLLKRSTSQSKPPGTLFALSLQEDEAHRFRELPDLYSLGDRVRLYYQEAE